MWGKSAPDNGTTQQTTKPPAAKSSGMEMMVSTLLKSMGVTPDMLTGYIADGKRLASEFVGAMVSVDRRLAEMQAEQREQRNLLEFMKAQMLANKPVEEIYPDDPAQQN